MAEMDASADDLLHKVKTKPNTRVSIRSINMSYKARIRTRSDSMAHTEL